MIHMSIEEPKTTTAAISTWLPRFWPANPWIWFIQAEVQFSRRGITAFRMKYGEIVWALPTENATEVQDHPLNTPEDDPYERLKDQLTLRIADSELQNIWQLHTVEELGDRKPTLLLCKMQQLPGGKALFDSWLLKKQFLPRLPYNEQMILATANEMSIDKLADMADRVMETATPTVTAVNTSTGDDGIRRLIHQEVNMAQRT